MIFVCYKFDEMGFFFCFYRIPGYYGIPLLIFVLSIQIYTAVVLGRCWIIAEKLDPRIIDKKRWDSSSAHPEFSFNYLCFLPFHDRNDRCPYAAVAELVYGKRMRIFVAIMLNIAIFGAGIPNILVGMHLKYNFKVFVLSKLQWYICIAMVNKRSPFFWFHWSFTKPSINWPTHQRQWIPIIFLLLAGCAGNSFVSDHVARKPKEYEVFVKWFLFQNLIHFLNCSLSDFYDWKYTERLQAFRWWQFSQLPYSFG